MLVGQCRLEGTLSEFLTQPMASFSGSAPSNSANISDRNDNPEDDDHNQDRKQLATWFILLIVVARLGAHARTVSPERA